MGRRKVKRRVKRGPPAIVGRSPAALFRFAVRDVDNRDIIDASVLGQMSAEELDRDGAPLVAAADSPRALVEALPRLRRAAIRVWEIKVREWPPEEVAPLLGDVLDQLYTHADEGQRERMYDAVIGALRWMGVAGGDVLLSRFDGLPPSAACRAAVALGLLGRAEAANRMRDLYAAVREQPGFDHAGALWGLIDLGDARVALLLVDEFARTERVPELYDLCTLAGEPNLVPPLLIDLHDSGDRGPLDTLYAIYWRAGREAFLQAAADAGIGVDSITPLADVFAESEPSPEQMHRLWGAPAPEDAEAVE